MQEVVHDFWEFNIGHLIDAGLFVTAAAGYILSRKSDIRIARSERERVAEEQIKMHTENKERLGVLMTFHENQLEINHKRDEQISLLRENAASLTRIVEGQDRRLQMLENKRSN